MTAAAVLAGCAPAERTGEPAAIDGDGIPAPIDGLTGDAARGQALLRGRDPANCVLCHAVPGFAVAGNLGPPLAGVGARLSPAQLRLRVVDERRVMPQTIMPSYHVTADFRDVASQYRGRPILDAQQVEDIVAFLVTLR
ncbi:MAG TPA: sulfur oxidation c-type cytochrome SoxX [Casimicrobiaceae bacterium]|nr:sulfur oxidation c-type cytochrome SoxX [Casimicrobiaceae bacterium]